MFMNLWFWEDVGWDFDMMEDLHFLIDDGIVGTTSLFFKNPG